MENDKIVADVELCETQARSMNHLLHGVKTFVFFRLVSCVSRVVVSKMQSITPESQISRETISLKPKFNAAKYLFLFVERQMGHKLQRGLIKFFPFSFRVV